MYLAYWQGNIDAFINVCDWALNRISHENAGVFHTIIYFSSLLVTFFLSQIELYPVTIKYKPKKYKNSGEKCSYNPEALWKTTLIELQ